MSESIISFDVPRRQFRRDLRAVEKLVGSTHAYTAPSITPMALRADETRHERVPEAGRPERRGSPVSS